MDNIINIGGYTISYINKEPVQTTDTAIYQSKIEEWKTQMNKELDTYKIYKDFISSLKNRVFSQGEWEIVANHWQDIYNSIQNINVDNALDLYKKLTGDYDKGEKNESNIQLFSKFASQKKEGKQFSRPMAEIYRLFAAYKLDVFCPIINDDYLNHLINLLKENGYIEELKSNNKEIEPRKIHWCIKSALLRKYFEVVYGKEYKDSIPWGVYMKLKNTEVKDLLIHNKNLIFTGAPGTGKTYLAKQIAEEIVKEELNKPETKGEVGFTQFHPSYDYTDFVEGLRPNKQNSFDRIDGIFKSFCKKAIDKPNANFVFIIDEINRGEISKIFGELFFSIDIGYREEGNKKERVQTQYQNLIKNIKDPFKYGFYVPSNVYIIGTMNDIDRSVESMDFAFRRRFAFYEVKATDEMLDTFNIDTECKVMLKKKMNALNKAIVEQGLTEAYQIGGAYFKKIEKLYVKDGNTITNYNKTLFTQALEKLWNYHIKGTLYEYFRGEPDADKKMEELKNAYDNAH